MNNTSRLIVNCIRDLNTEAEQNIAGYSIDAGFHVFIFSLAKDLSKVKAKIMEICSEQLERVIETEIDTEGV
jgi:mevalonate pyrophosphate decarboxylase